MNIIMQIKDNTGIPHIRLTKQKRKEFMNELDKLFKKYNLSGKY